MASINRSCCTTIDSIDTGPYKFSTTTKAQAEPKKHTVIAVAKKILVPIDEDIANRHGIKDGDIVLQVEDGTGTIKLIFKDTKNRNSRPEPDDQDNGE